MASRTALLTAAAAMAVVVVVALLPVTASAANYKVGWNPFMNYDIWASDKTFKVGDTIEFVYLKGLYNVVQVDEANYNACTVPNDANTWTSGDDWLRFNAAGPYFFINGVDNLYKFCLKLALNVIQ